MFMWAVLLEEGRFGLLMFDELGAGYGTSGFIGVTSLRIDDHLTGKRLDLFTRIRKLRRGKTVVFSSHLFGELTKPATLFCT